MFSGVSSSCNGPSSPACSGCRSGMSWISTFQCRSITLQQVVEQFPGDLLAARVPLQHRLFEDEAERSTAAFRCTESSFCRSRRAAIRLFSSSSTGSGGTLIVTARAYASVCNRPGIRRHSYVHRLIAVPSSCAHRRNHAASPGCRVRNSAAFFSAPVLPSTTSARSTNSGSGIRLPNSTEATVCSENRTASASSFLLIPMCSRNAWTTAPNVRKLSENSGSPLIVPACPQPSSATSRALAPLHTPDDLMITYSDEYCPVRNCVRRPGVHGCDLAKCASHPSHWAHERTLNPSTPGHRTYVRPASELHPARRAPRPAPRRGSAARLGHPVRLGRLRGRRVDRRRTGRRTR